MARTTKSLTAKERQGLHNGERPPSPLEKVTLTNVEEMEALCSATKGPVRYDIEFGIELPKVIDMHYYRFWPRMIAVNISGCRQGAAKLLSRCSFTNLERLHLSFVAPEDLFHLGKAELPKLRQLSLAFAMTSDNWSLAFIVSRARFMMNRPLSLDIDQDFSPRQYALIGFPGALGFIRI